MDFAQDFLFCATNFSYEETTENMKEVYYQLLDIHGSKVGTIDGIGINECDSINGLRAAIYVKRKENIGKSIGEADFLIFKNEKEFKQAFTKGNQSALEEAATSVMDLVKSIGSNILWVFPSPPSKIELQPAPEVSMPDFENVPANFVVYPFFEIEIEQYLGYFKDNALLARDQSVKKVNEIVLKRHMNKYRPIVVSTSRGMGKTSFIEAIGLQLVKPGLKNQLILDALSCGRILSFDFADAAAETAIPAQEDIKTFFTRLMVYFLCRLFNGTHVGGINFERISHFSEVPTFSAKQLAFKIWLSECLRLNTDDMIDEYIRLTNIAFKVKCYAPPVFLLDEIQKLCIPTTIQSKFQSNQVIYHTFLSLLLTQLAGRHKPVCIATGTNSGNLVEITERSAIVPEFISLESLHDKTDHLLFWRQNTDYLNCLLNGNACLPDEDDDLVSALIYASYGIPRLLSIAHQCWYSYQNLSPFNDCIAPLQNFESDAVKYYDEMAEIFFNPGFSIGDICHIIFACSVYWPVGNTKLCIPGTIITWDSLITKSLVFPYVENCFVFPFNLIWRATTPASTPTGHYHSRKEEIENFCKSKIPNLNVNHLHPYYDYLRKLDLYNFGIAYENLVVSALAVKFYLCKVEQDQKNESKKFQKGISFADLYHFEHEEGNVLRKFYVDFSKGIELPSTEIYVTTSNLPTTAIIHNKKIHNAHHDFLISGTQETTCTIPVSCKASFELSPTRTIQSQLKISKKDNNEVQLLIWLYLGTSNREEGFSGKVVFIDGSGCCNGLALDMFILIKKLISQNNKLLH